jgi:hypothetical protein
LIGFLDQGTCMTTESVSTASSDPLKVVADAMDAAAKAAREGVEEARATASDAIPAAGRLMSRLIYKTCYSISYGVVFPTVLIARSIPKDNAAVHGLIDGAHAAIDMVNEMKTGSAVVGNPGVPPLGPGGESAHSPSIS